MKLIIDIPEHDKNVIERFVRGDGCEDMPPSIIENLIRAVYFGTPLEKHDAISRQDVLDKIRTEIEEHRNKTMLMDKYDLVGDCLDIIDKYKKAESEK